MRNTVKCTIAWPRSAVRHLAVIMNRYSNHYSSPTPPMTNRLGTLQQNKPSRIFNITPLPPHPPNPLHPTPARQSTNTPARSRSIELDDTSREDYRRCPPPPLWQGAPRAPCVRRASQDTPSEPSFSGAIRSPRPHSAMLPSTSRIRRLRLPICLARPACTPQTSMSLPESRVTS